MLRVKSDATVVLAVTDRGSGIDPASIVVLLDGQERTARLVGGTVRVRANALAKGSHKLRVQVSDYQESRNMENVGPILPNTRILTTSFVVS